MVLMKKIILNQIISVLILEIKIKINKSHIILGFAGRYAKQKNINGLLIAFSRFSKDLKMFIYVWLEKI